MDKGTGIACPHDSTSLGLSTRSGPTISIGLDGIDYKGILPQEAENSGYVAFCCKCVVISYLESPIDEKMSQK